LDGTYQLLDLAVRRGLLVSALAIILAQVCKLLLSLLPSLLSIGRLLREALVLLLQLLDTRDMLSVDIGGGFALSGRAEGAW
jgi:hypothetical protein